MAVKPSDLNSVPGIHGRKRKPPPERCPLPDMHASMHASMHTLERKERRNKEFLSGF